MKIDVSEVRVQKELLVISVNSIKEQLSVSRSRLSEVVSTDSLKGAVKDAINQKVTNYQIPLVDNYVNALDSIVSRYDGLVKLFQDTVSETDNSAIIKTEYLERIKQRMKDPIEGLKSSSSKTQNIYAGISDILTLTNPSLDNVNTSYNQAVKSLDDTIKNMEAFNSVLLKTDTFDLIDMQIVKSLHYQVMPLFRIGTANREIIIIELSLKIQFQRYTQLSIATPKL